MAEQSIRNRQVGGSTPPAGPTLAQLVREHLAEENPEACLADGFDEALIGVARRCSKAPLAVYSVERILEILVGQGLEYEEAVEHFSFNIEGAWVGEGTQLFLTDFREVLS